MAALRSQNNNRAEIFEDEKRRIIFSCFSKKDEDGSIFETYITHIRITEYSTSPSAPPPPHARTPQAEKPRIIIIAVRQSGRVRMHKAKENPNGTFSVGKTWNLDDMTAIESYTDPNSGDPDRREWASNVGFTITLAKPYYWQAQTDAEKKFFIASLIKIYAKYTGGSRPVLTGFDRHELDLIINGAQARRPERPLSPRIQTPMSERGLGEVVAGFATPPPMSVSLNGVISPEPSGTASPFTTPSTRGASPIAPPYQQPQQLPLQALPPRFNRGPGPSPGVTHVGRALPEIVDSVDLAKPSSQDHPSSRRFVSNNEHVRNLDMTVTSTPLTRGEDGILRLRVRGATNGTGAGESVNEVGDGVMLGPGPPSAPPTTTAYQAAEDLPPARRRPPMDPSQSQAAAEDLVPAPLQSGTRREPAVPPRSAERMSPRKVSDGAQALAARDEPPEMSRTDALGSPDAPRMSPPPPDVDSRPGLGPMIKSMAARGDKAATLWKTASAAPPFKPRVGGAMDRLRQMQAKGPKEGSDDITSVVPTPDRPGPAVAAETNSAARFSEQPSPQTRIGNSAVPEVKLTVPDATSQSALLAAGKVSLHTQDPTPIELERNKALRPHVLGNDKKYFATLGVDPSILDSRGTDFARWLDYFGWLPGEQMRVRSYDDITAEIERELNRTQAGGWLARFREGDERVEAIKNGLDLAMAECEELDNLLTLYSVELSTLADDIAYIEAQGQGLQVQAANQKLLRGELESLLETCAIDMSDLVALRQASLESNKGIGAIEQALVTLFTAIMKIDPTIGKRDRETNDADPGSEVNTDYASMRIVQEKKEMYNAESMAFTRRLVSFMADQFDAASAEVRRSCESSLSTKKVEAHHHEASRTLLWKYSPLMLYARDVDRADWDRILQVYQDKSLPVYRNEFRESLESWKRKAHKAIGDEAELLFTFQQEKKEERLTTKARTLTVKRSQTLARTLRSPLSDGSKNLDKSGPDGRIQPHEVFAGLLDEILPLVEMEQNFVVDFFHATTLEQLDFPEVVSLAHPQDRRGVTDLKRHRPMEPSRDLGRRIQRAMETIFSFLESSLQNLIDWTLAVDPLQAIGVLAILERWLAELGQTNQDFLNNTCQKLHGNVEGRLVKFVDEQIRGIEETKVKINKRKGVINFISVFPKFSGAVENMLANFDENLPIRRMANHEYARILKTMFDSLKVIARENPAAGLSGAAAASSTYPEDKEALNYHILLIENMNHYLEEVENPRGNMVIEEWKETARNELAEHISLYLNAVMRRPLGKLLDQLDNIESQLSAGKAAAAVASQPSNTPAVFNKILGAYDGREVRKGIETLRKRVEKHFGDADDPDLSRALVTKVTHECEEFYGHVEMRIGRMVTDVYAGEVAFEWPRMEVKNAFR